MTAITRMLFKRSSALLLAGAGLMVGCQNGTSGVASRAATQIDPATSHSAYWFSKAGVATVHAASFETLWEGAIREARENWFTVDRLDYREGVITTQPLVSRQAFEFWRNDVASPHDLIQSTLSSIRRTIRFEISRDPDGGYRLTPKVVVERHSIAEHRVTSVVEYKDIYATDRPLEIAETEAGTPLIPDYWFAIGRDPALERRLAASLSESLKSR